MKKIAMVVTAVFLFASAAIAADKSTTPTQDQKSVLQKPVALAQAPAANPAQVNVTVNQKCGECGGYHHGTGHKAPAKKVTKAPAKKAVKKYVATSKPIVSRTSVSSEELPTGKLSLAGPEGDLEFALHGNTHSVKVPISQDQIDKHGQGALAALKPYASYAVFVNGGWKLRGERNLAGHSLRGGVSGTYMDVTINITEEMRKNGPWVWFRMWGEAPGAVLCGDSGFLWILQASQYYRLSDCTLCKSGEKPAYEWMLNVRTGEVRVVPSSFDKRI